VGSDDGAEARKPTHSERQMAYASAKRASGKCGYSGCHALSPDRYYCERHRTKVKSTKQARLLRVEGHDDDESEAA